MNSLALFILIASAAVVMADDDLLQNGDFSHGLAHWNGNVRAPADVAGAGTIAGAVIKLRASDWTKATQDFEIKPGTYKLHVSFTLSADTHFSDQLTDYINVPAKLDFPEDHPVQTEAGQWVVAVSDATARKSLCWMINPSRPSGPQSYTFTVKDIDFNNRQTLLLSFPPGSGLVTLQHVSLVPADAH